MGEKRTPIATISAAIGSHVLSSLSVGAVEPLVVMARAFHIDYVAHLELVDQLGIVLATHLHKKLLPATNPQKIQTH
eukprot:SAG11_NODE_12056_length_724_cov_0.744000_1_plen_77_part_00